MARRKKNQGRPLYMISVASELAGLHPQTLRIYERKRLICPQRSAGNTRLYSDEDIERLRLITELTEEGVNLAGVARILEMRDELEAMRRRLDRMQARLDEVEARAKAEVARARRAVRAEIVHVRRGAIERHGDL
ncbi:MAG: hypothetical protein Kow0056_10680 [Coriobacteriia bacterium]